MASSTQHFSGLVSEFESVVAFYATFPEQCDLNRLLKLNFEVHQGLKRNPDVRTSYLKQAMDILKNPLRQNLPIPWDRVKRLDTLRRIRAPDPINPSPGPSSQRVSKREAVAPAANDKALGERQPKRRKFEGRQSKGPSQAPSSRRDGKKKNVETHEGDITVKMEEMHVEQSGVVFDDFDVLQKLCDNCLRSNQKECVKSGRGGACDHCAKRHLGCNLTEAVKAHWTAIGDPRGRSRSRSRSRSVAPRTKSRAPSVAPRTKSRAPSIASTSSRPAPKSARAGHPGTAKVMVMQAEQETGQLRATPAPRERRTNTQRIAQLEHGLLEMQQQLESTNKELSKLIVEIEERKVIEGQLRRELEQYHREYGSSMSYADQYMDAVGHVNEFGLTRKAGVGPEAVQIEQGVQLSPMDDCMGKGDVQNKRGAEATPMEDGVHPEAAESVQRPAETSQMEDEPSGSASMNNIVSIPRATCPDAPQAQEVSPMHVGSGEMIDTETAATEGKQRQEEGATLEIGIGESSQSTEGTQSELLCQGPPPADDQTQNTPDVATNHPSSRMAPESTSIMEVGTANEGTVGSGVAH